MLKSSGCLSELTVNAGGPPTTPSPSAGSFLPFRGLYSSRCKTGPKGSPCPSSVAKVTIERCRAESLDLTRDELGTTSSFP